MKNKKNYITIVGSYNVGLFFKGKEHPKCGETVIGDSFLEGGGGKGSNQCIAATRLGANVRFIGCIGDDKYGKDALTMYKNEGVNTDGIRICNDIHTGIGVILIDSHGQNMISIIPGANYYLSTKDIDNAVPILKESFIVGFQLENDIKIVEYGIKKCAELGIEVLLDPAPAQKLSEDIYPCITYIKPNESEAETLTGIHVNSKKTAFEAANWFKERGVGKVLITLGDQGVAYSDKNGEKFYPVSNDKAVDTTGAGDCFCGAFMAKISSGSSIDNAIVFAIMAAGKSVTKLGVIESLPFLKELNHGTQ